MSKPHRLHPAAILILAIKSAHQLAKSALIPFGAWLVSQASKHGLTGRHLLWVVAGVLALLVLAIGWGILSWRRFTYRVEDGELRLEHGIIQRQKRFIPRERIQSIDLEEGILHRVFGVVGVRIETAGGTKEEAALTAVSRLAARQLRRELMIETALEGGTEPAGATTGSRGPVLVYQMSWRMLLIAGVTSGRFTVLLPFLGGIYSLLDEVQLTDKVIQALGSRIQGSATTTFVLAAVLMGLLLAWLLSILLTVVTYANFRLKLEEDALLIQRGLISRRHSTIPLSRIQAVRIVEGLLRQPFGLVSIRVESAGYGVKEREATVVCPLLTKKDVPQFLRKITPEFGDALWTADGTAIRPFRRDLAHSVGEAKADGELQRLPVRARRRFVVRACIPAAVVTGVVCALAAPWGLLSFALLPLAASIGVWRYRDAGWYASGDKLVLQSRRLTRTTAIVTRRRIQTCSLTQSILQRRADLATFEVRVASGPSGATFRIRDIEHSDGQRLYAWVCGNPIH
jgi:putative membrane protein